MRKRYWLICAMFGHEARGLMDSSWRDNYRQTIRCACGKREHTREWYESGRRRA